MKIDLSELLSRVYYLGTIETHILFLVLSNLLLVRSRPASGFRRFAARSVVFYLLIFFGFSVLYRPFVSTNIFRATGLTRNTLAKADIESMLGDLEDRSFDDKDAQEYIQSLEEKLLGEKSSYYLRGEDLFGDKFQGLSFEGRISTQKKISEWKLYAEFLILLYSTMAMFPPRVSRLLKLVTLAAGAGLGYISWVVSESESVDRSQSAEFQNFFFEAYFFGVKFDQFCIFNLIDLLKGLASFVMMALVYLAHCGFADPQDEIRRKLGLILKEKNQGPQSFEEKLKRFSEDELGKLLESRESANRKNKKFILLMLLGLGGLAAFNKYELLTAHLAEQTAKGKSGNPFDFEYGQ